MEFDLSDEGEKKATETLSRQLNVIDVVLLRKCQSLQINRLLPNINPHLNVDGIP